MKLPLIFRSEDGTTPSPGDLTPAGDRLDLRPRQRVAQSPRIRTSPGLIPTALLVHLFVLLSPVPLQAARQSGRLEAIQLEDRVRVTLDGGIVTEYRYAPDQKYPYFYPVNGPASGTSVTTESSQPYPHHHSLFFGSDYVNGGNYWQDENERGQIIAQETRVLRAAGDQVEFSQTSLWMRPGAPSPFRDERTIRVSAPSPGVRLIDFDITLVPLMDVRIEQTNHSLFAARMAPSLSVDSGGVLLNSRGARNAEGTFGQPAEWADYSGTRNGIVEGLAILNHPENAWTPPPWFTRDYGFFSPTPFNWMENGFLSLAEGEPLRLRYRVVVHTGGADEARIADLYADYVGVP